MAEEQVRETVTIQRDGRMTIPDVIRKKVDIYGKKAFCEVTNYGKDKILLTILTRWQPPSKGKPEKDIVER